MSNTVIKIENLYKEYRLGVIGHGTLYQDLQSWWAKANSNPDPNSLLDMVNPNQGKDRILALNDINLEVKDGEVLGIIGANGAGKSTLLKILSKITTPTSGTIKYKGRIASLLEVGTGFHTELTGRENIFLNGAINGMNKREVSKKLDEIVDFSGVEKFLDTPVKRYSSGMFVRLGFAVAAHLDPDILAVDEVLAVGDASFQKKAIRKMRDVSKGEGRTVLFVSHNMQSIINLCTRVIMLKGGEIIKDGKPEDVVSNYLSDDESATGELLWLDPKEAPGNDKVRLYSVRILQDSNDKPMRIVDRCKDIKIEITYIVLEEDLPLYSAFFLKNKMGIKVLSSSNHRMNNIQEDKWFDKLQPIGKYKSICCIPANLLIEGEYYISPIIGLQPKYTQVLLEDIISFRTRDTGEENRNAFGGWWGVVGPPMAWETERLDP